MPGGGRGKKKKKDGRRAELDETGGKAGVSLDSGRPNFRIPPSRLLVLQIDRVTCVPD